MPQPVRYTDAETDLTGQLYRPEGTPRAAVLVLPTIMNPTPAVLEGQHQIARGIIIQHSGDDPVIQFWMLKLPPTPRAQSRLRPDRVTA